MVVDPESKIFLGRLTMIDQFGSTLTSVLSSIVLSLYFLHKTASGNQEHTFPSSLVVLWPVIFIPPLHPIPLGENYVRFDVSIYNRFPLKLI